MHPDDEAPEEEIPDLDAPLGEVLALAPAPSLARRRTSGKASVVPQIKPAGLSDNG